ncbi:hypothetical protein FGE05_14345 [Pseudomonas sp. ICMP22404]|nr:hypothetical protein FGE05_14345 [Pseudomonas sp. ICMP22404]
MPHKKPRLREKRGAFSWALPGVVMFLWEWACSRSHRWVRYLWWLTHCYREQARSHRYGVWRITGEHCRPHVGASLLAMAAAHPPSIQTDSPPSRASPLLQAYCWAML